MFAFIKKWFKKKKQVELTEEIKTTATVEVKKKKKAAPGPNSPGQKKARKKKRKRIAKVSRKINK